MRIARSIVVFVEGVKKHWIVGPVFPVKYKEAVGLMLDVRECLSWW
jgi:hypothetical protein